MSEEEKTPETVPESKIVKSDPIKHPDEAINLPIKEKHTDTTLEIKKVETKTKEEPKDKIITPIVKKRGRGRPKKIITEEEQIKIDKEKVVNKERIKQMRLINLAKGRIKGRAKIKENKAKRDAEKKKKHEEERGLILLERDKRIRAQRKAKVDKKKLEEIEAKLEEPTETELELQDTQAELKRQKNLTQQLQQDRNDEIEHKRLMAEEIKNEELERIRTEEELRNRIRPMRSKRRAYRYL